MIQANIMKIDIKKCLNKRFLISITGLTIFLLIGLFQYYNGKTLGYSDNNAIHAFLAVIENNHTILPSMAILLSTIVCGDSLYNEYRSGHLRNIVSRFSLKQYILIKAIVNIIISAIVVMIPMIIMMITSLLIFDLDKSILSDPSYYGPTGKLVEIYVNYPIFYMIISIALMGVFVAMYSTLSIGIAFYAKFRSVSIIIPVLAYNIFQFISELVGHEIALNDYQRPMIGMLFTILMFDYQMFLWYILILIIASSLVYFKLKKGLII